MVELQEFRDETRVWLTENCPEGARGPGEIHTGSTRLTFSADTQRWMELMAERGWTVPDWPKDYGGGGLSPEETRILYEEMVAIGARAPLVNMGTRMLGPTLLEFGTEDQKKRHLTVIAREVPPGVRGIVNRVRVLISPACVAAQMIRAITF